MSTFGTAFKITTFGESHGTGVGVIIDGVPPLMKLSAEDIQPQLTRRRPGQSEWTTPRNEADKVTIQSGTENGITLGTPLSLYVKNNDFRPTDYSDMSAVPRPSHADFTYVAKYQIKASSGGGRSSARETIGRVASGAVAEKWLKEKFGIEIVAWVSGVGPIESKKVDGATITRAEVDESKLRCPDKEATIKMMEVVKACKDESDSTGGVVECICRNVPAGWGEPCFDKLEAKLAHAMMSIPATKGFEIGSGFSGTKLRGSEHNDPFVLKDGRLGTTTNNSGGTQGGISNGEAIHFRIAFKPPATIGREQSTSDFSGNSTKLAARGRHDPCVVPRAVPIVEAMAALVLADAALLQLARQSAHSHYKSPLTFLNK